MIPSASKVKKVWPIPYVHIPLEGMEAQWHQKHTMSMSPCYWLYSKGKVLWNCKHCIQATNLVLLILHYWSYGTSWTKAVPLNVTKTWLWKQTSASSKFFFVLCSITCMDKYSASSHICLGEYTWLLPAVAENVKDQPGESHP